MTEHAKNTPGPWLVEGNLIYALDETGRANRFSARIDGGYSYGGNRLKENNVRTTGEELSANTSLIKASPELLHALLCLVEWVDDHAVKPNEIPEVIAARAAIAEATKS